MLKKYFGVMLVFVLATLLAVPTGAQSDVFMPTPDDNPEFSWDSLDSFEGMDMAGEEVTVFGAFVDTDAARFNAAMAPFEEATGIDVVYEGSGDFESLVRVRVDGNDAPDIAAFPQPGLMRDLSDNMVPLSDELLSYVEENYDQGWIELSRGTDGEVKNVVYRANVKSLVWFSPDNFFDAGYEIPETWDEMLELSDLIVEDGATPWCIGIESAGATGWVVTDWVEDVMLRTAPAETYDAWVSNEIPFDDPAVVNALNVVGEIMLNDDYVSGGTDAILTTPFGDSPSGLFGDDPECYMHRQASFIPGFFPDGTEIAEDGDAWAFYLPPIDTDIAERPLLTAGDLFGAFNDDPATAALMEYLATPLAQEIWAAQGGFVAPNVNASLEVYPTDIDRFYGELLATATVSRFDGSDNMPAAIGAGVWWTQAVEWVQSGSAEEALAAVEEEWQGLE
jgi:alpha-glucoside transport system substrate-binding protein